MKQCFFFFIFRQAWQERHQRKSLLPSTADMTARVLCPALDAMLRKTIIALCEVNVQYNLCLEISGSLHIRADGERVFNCLIEEELNGKEKKMRKDSLNDIAGFSIDLAKLHRDSMDSFTEREDEFEGDELELEDEATLADGAAQSEALEVSSASSSQYSKSPASADVAPCGGAGSDLDHVPSTSAVGCGIPTMHPSQAKSNLATIFPTPKIEPNTNTSAAQNTFLMSTPTTCNNPTSDGTAPQNSLVNSTACNLAAVASANPNLNLQAVAIAAAIQRAAEASKKNIGMVLPTQNAATATNSASASTSMMETNQPPAQEPMPQVTVKARNRCPALVESQSLVLEQHTQDTSRQNFQCCSPRGVCSRRNRQKETLL